MSLRLAAVDLGSNSAKLSVVEVDGDGHARVIDRDRVVLSLGRQVAQDGALGADAIARTTEVMQAFVDRARALEVDDMRAVATSACRDATDGDDLRQAVRHACGLNVAIITGREEGELAWRAVAHRAGVDDDGIGLFDVGGGSTELVCRCGRVMVSVPLGAARLTERFGCQDRMSADVRHALVDHIDATLATVRAEIESPPTSLYGMGGTVTALALLDVHGHPLPAKDRRDVSETDGHRVSADTVRSIGQALGDMSCQQRREVAGLGPTRARIIVAGITIVERTLAMLGCDAFEVVEQGIRDGLVRAMIETHRGSGER